jgi:hypothetical protein
VRRKLALLLGLTFAVALARYLGRSTAQPLLPTRRVQREPDPREELRRKLARTRRDEAEAGPATAIAEVPAPALPSAEAARPSSAVDEERRGVHERARAAIEEMRASESESSASGER